MGRADMGDDGGIGAGDVGQHADFPGMIHSHLPHAVAVALVAGKDGEGKTNVVVEVPGRRIDGSPTGEHGGEKILR